jgi:hypothetical protein
VGSACSTHGEKRKAYRILGKPKDKRSLGISRCRPEGNIKMDLRETGGAIWIRLI